MARISQDEINPDAGTPSDFEVFPAGPQSIQLVESDIAPNSKGTGKVFKFKSEVTAGDYTGRFIWGNMNLTNSASPIAEKIGQEEFKALREVVGVIDVDDTEELHFKEFTAVIKITPAKGEYKAKNEINWGATWKLFSNPEGAAKDAAANDNNKAAANDNKSTSVGGRVPAGSGTAGRKPWPKAA
jgi:hypothetical protein